MLFRLRWLQKEPFINDEEDGAGVPGLNFPVGAIGACHIELKEHIRQADILCPITLFAGLHAEGAGHVGLAASRGASDEQVPVFRDVLTGCQPFDQAAVEFPAGSIVNVGDTGLRLVKPGTFDKALQAVALTIVVFDVDQEAETVLEWDVLHLRVIHLCKKSIRHGRQAHFNEFIDGVLVGHGSYLL